MSVYDGVCQFVAWFAVGWCFSAALERELRRRRERWLISGRWFGHGRLVIWGARRGDTIVGDPHDLLVEALRNAARPLHVDHIHVSYGHNPQTVGGPLTEEDIERMGVAMERALDMRVEYVSPAELRRRLGL